MKLKLLLSTTIVLTMACQKEKSKNTDTPTESPAKVAADALYLDAESAFALLPEDSEGVSSLTARNKAHYDGFLGCFTDSSPDTRLVAACGDEFDRQTSELLEEAVAVLDVEAKEGLQKLTDQLGQVEATPTSHANITDSIATLATEINECFDGVFAEEKSIDQSIAIKKCWQFFVSREVSIRTDIDALEADPFPL